MKKKLYICIAMICCALGAVANPPLKQSLLPDTQAWSIQDLPSDFMTLQVPGIEEENTPALADQLADFAAKFLGRRYRYGSTGPKTFDCSGFTRFVFRKIGISLNRTSRSQYAQGESVRKSELQPGDLMFFSSPRTRKGVVGHVAIVVDVNPDGSCTFIHASTTKGITYQNFPDGGYFSRNYIGARRVLS